MKISSVRCVLLSAPYATEGDAERVRHLASGYRAAALVKIETDESLYGLGEPFAGSFVPLAVREIVTQTAELLVGASPLDVESCMHRLQHAVRYWGRTGLAQGVIGAMEMALFDIKGKATGLPVYELLGGQTAPALRVYASGGSDKSDAELRREMKAYVTAGYSAVKIRIINLTEQQLLTKVALCHEALDGKLGLAVDAVQSNALRPWTLKEAKRYAAMLEPFNLLWLEEPLPPEDLDGLRELRHSTSIPIAGAETATTVLEANRYIRAEALDLLQPDASMIGGLRNFVRTGMLAEAAGMELAVHAWCGGVGHMANYHAAFATRSCRYLEMSTVYNPLREGVLIEPWKLQSGSLALAPSAGLGVQLTSEMEKEFAFREGSHYRYNAK